MRAKIRLAILNAIRKDNDATIEFTQLIGWSGDRKGLDARMVYDPPIEVPRDLSVIGHSKRSP
jgi:hypothetical protein